MKPLITQISRILYAKRRARGARHTKTSIRVIRVIRGLNPVALSVLLLAGCATSPEVETESANKEPAKPSPPTLSVTVSSVTLNDVPLGTPVALRLPNGGYYALRNDSPSRLKARIFPMKPTYCERKKGEPVYSPIGDIGWVTVEPREFEIPPHCESEAMVVVRLPDDPALLGKHLEFWIKAQAVVNGMASVALYSRIRLDVAKERSQLEKVRARAPEMRKLKKPQP